MKASLAVAIQAVARLKVPLNVISLKWGETSPAHAAVNENTKSVVGKTLNHLLRKTLN